MSGKIIVPSVFLAVLIIAIVVLIGYPFKVRLFPLMIGFPVAALLLAQILKEASAKAKQGKVPGQEESAAADITFGGYLRVGGWVATLLVLIYLLGLTVGTTLFTILYLKLKRENWRMAVGCALGVVVLVYGGFGMAFKTYLYKGLLLELLFG